jgi:hypothetical protein
VCSTGLQKAWPYIHHELFGKKNLVLKYPRGTDQSCRENVLEHKINKQYISRQLGQDKVNTDWRSHYFITCMKQDEVEDLCVDGRIIFKWITKKGDGLH